MNNITKDALSYSTLLASIASLGGLLFGFNAGIISGALPFLKNNWGGLSSNQSDWVIITLLIGAAIGALLSIKLSDKFGRRVLLVYTSIIYAVGAVLSGASTSVTFLLISRIILGVAMGLSSTIVPMYISEVSPAKNRGALVSLFQLMITIGILLSFYSNNLFANEFDPFSWRNMFYLGTIPAILFFIGTFILPESPRFSVNNGNIWKAKETLKKIEPLDLVEKTAIIWEENSILYAKQNKVWRKSTRNVLLMVIGLMFLQQFVGINTVIYYSPIIFSNFIQGQTLIDISLSIGLVNVLSTIVAILLIDKIGRRRLFFIGLGGMTASLLFLGVIFLFLNNLSPMLQMLTLIVILVYIVFFAISLGPLAWLILSEVFPLNRRGFGMSLGAFSNWAFNAIITIAILKFAWVFDDIENVSRNVDTSNFQNFGALFFIFAVIALIGIYWGRKNIPETKGLSLEIIEELWRKGIKPSEFKSYSK